MAEKRQMPDEISAINRIGRILESLEDDERRRVLTWIVDKFGCPSEMTWSVRQPRTDLGSVRSMDHDGETT